MRRAAVRSLAAIDTPDVLVPLLGRLDDTTGDVRVEAAQSLGAIGNPQAVVPLVGRTRDDAPEVRIAAYAALGDIGDPRALPALLQGIRDDVLDARLAAITALGRLGAEDAVAPLDALTLEPEPRTARASVAALASIPGDEATHALVEALARHATRGLAGDGLFARAQRLASRGDDALATYVLGLLRELARASGTATANVLAEVVSRILEAYPVPAAADPLVEGVRDGWATQSVLLVALAATGSEEALVPVLSQLRSDEPDVQEAAVRALEIYFESGGA